MRLKDTYTLSQVASLLELPFKGNPNIEIQGINEIHRVKSGDIAFVDYSKYYDKAIKSSASVILIDQEIDIPDNKGLIISSNPFRDFNYLLNYFKPFEFSAKAREQFEVGKNSKIHESVTIGRNVVIGNNVIIFPNVTILDDVQIGNDVIIQSGTIIGSLGFYYKNCESHYDRLNSCGSVIIGDKVEIGANCTVDKGVTSETRIMKGTKIDNLVQIGHDTVIGENCLIASQSGIAGCVTIEDSCTIWGQVGIASGVTIGRKATLGAKSGISKSLKGNRVYVGIPADEIRIKHKEQAAIRSLVEQL